MPGCRRKRHSRARIRQRPGPILVWRCSISELEGLPHVPGHGAGDKENVGVPGRCHELQTKSFYIVDGVILWAAVTGAIALFGRRYYLHFSDWTREERAMVEFLTWLKQSNVNFETVLATIVLLVAASVVIHFLNRLMLEIAQGNRTATVHPLWNPAYHYTAHHRRFMAYHRYAHPQPMVRDCPRI